jgi:hypothetical protein
MRTVRPVLGVSIFRRSLGFLPQLLHAGIGFGSKLEKTSFLNSSFIMIPQGDGAGLSYKVDTGSIKAMKWVSELFRRLKSRRPQPITHMAGGVKLPDLPDQGVPCRALRGVCQLCFAPGFLGGNVLVKFRGGGATLHDNLVCLRVLTVGFAVTVLIRRHQNSFPK